MAILEETFLKILLAIDSAIYGFFSVLYSLYLELASAEIFTQELYQNITQKIYVIVGVIALFIFSYLVLQNIINPDNLKDNKKNGFDIIKNIMICFIMIILTPVIFNFLYTVQHAILTDQIIPNFLLGKENTETIVVQAEVEYEDGTTETFDAGEYETNDYDLKTYGNEMAIAVFSAFLHPKSGYTADKVTADVSKVLGTDEALKIAVKACFVGSLRRTFVAAGQAVIEIGASGGSATPVSVIKLVAKSGGAIVASCFKNAGGATIATGLMEWITSNEYSWKDALEDIQYGSDWDIIVPYASAVNKGTMEYLPIVSTVCGVIILWMMLSFCIDLGIRAVKLTFYQLIAPICFIMNVLPNSKDVLGKWIKAVLTTWAEVFIRIFLVCGVAYLFHYLNQSALDNLSFWGKALIIMGLIVGAKQLPKLLSELTGIDSGNMKIGLMEKLGAGGALAVGALVGGALTTGVRNGVNSWRNSKDKSWRERFTSTAKSVAGGAVSGGFRSAKNAGFKAKGFNDVKNAASSGAKAAHQKSKERMAYRAEHGDSWSEVFGGHVSDAIDRFTSWAGYSDDIIATVQYEDDYIAGLGDYESLFSNSSYKADEALLNEYKSKKAAMGDIIDKESGKYLSELIKDLETSMLNKRLTAINKNKDAVAYAAYNLAKQVQQNPEMARKAGVSSEFIANRKDFVLSNNRIYHADGVTEWSTDELQKLFEGSVATNVDSSGNVINSTTVNAKMYGTFEGLKKTKGKVVDQRNRDKGSIHYKEAKKAADNAKNQNK